MDNAEHIKQLRCVITVDDFDGALAFYREALGLREVESWASEYGRGVILDAGPGRIELLSRAEADLVDHVEVGSVMGASLRLGLGVSDANRLANDLEKAGALILAAPRKTPWATTSVRLATPEGIQLTLFT
ncbi:MAG: VOC family protein [Actinomycetota bacterium]